jgi:hypothetical protein
MAGGFERDNENSVSIKIKEFIGYPRNYNF